MFAALPLQPSISEYRQPIALRHGPRAWTSSTATVPDAVQSLALLRRGLS